VRRVVPLASLVLALGAAAALACSASRDVTDGDDGGAGDDGSATVPSGGGLGGGGASGPAGSGLDTGLPCDVQAVLENRCIACHDGSKAPPMLTYDDLMKKSTVDPTKTLAQEAVVRMQNGTMPPPPAAPPAADEIQSFAAWVGAGTPKNGTSCTTPPPGDAGADGRAAIDGGGDGAVVCTSGTHWTPANDNGPDMRPGEACNACHQIQGGPNLRIAGTVYPTLHEPDDCNGSKPPPPLTVVITDGNNRVFNLPVGVSGNFELGQRVTPPFSAKVTDGAKTRAMTGTVTSGDCNTCHTTLGKNGAPGRILAP
jgi:hypothetical protein